MESNIDLSLSRVLDSLSLEDGKGNVLPNITARRRLLDELVDHGLLSSEIRHMRERLNATPSPTKDIFGYLPQELQMQVVEHLDFESAVSMAMVSKSWRSSIFQEKMAFLVVENHPYFVRDILRIAFVSKTWIDILCQESITLFIIEMHFRKRWHQYLTAQPRQSPKELQDWLSDTLETLARQQMPTAIRCYNPHWKGEKLYGASNDRNLCRYANGRVAYRYSSRGVVVIGLCKADNNQPNKMMFMHKDRLLLHQWLLSDEMILAETTNPRRLMIGSFETREPYDLALPSGIKHWAASGRHFAVITETHELLSGTIDGSCKSVSEMPETSSGQKIIPIGIHYHPVEKDCFYVFYTVRAGDRLVTQEVLHGHPSAAPLETGLAPPSNSIDSNTIPSITPCDYLLGKGIVVTSRQREPNSILFDMYTKQYSTTATSNLHHAEPILDPEDIFRVIFKTLSIRDDMTSQHSREAFYIVCCFDAHVELADEGWIQPGSEESEHVERDVKYLQGLGRYEQVVSDDFDE